MARLRTLTAVFSIALLCGCARAPYWQAPGAMPIAMPVCHANPLFVACADHQRVWETLVDVIDDDFHIQHEEPVRVLGDTVTEGRLETFPEIGATIFEPWRHDSASPYEKIESTLQTIRRRISARVSPGNGGYWIEIVAHKELEDLPRPAMSTAGAATFRYDSSLTRIVNPEAKQGEASGWVPQGRDTDLEQWVLGHLAARFGGIGSPVPIGQNGLQGPPNACGPPLPYCVCRAQSPEPEDCDYLQDYSSASAGGHCWASISGRSFQTIWESSGPVWQDSLGMSEDSPCGEPEFDRDCGIGAGCGLRRHLGCGYRFCDGCLDRWWHSPRTQDFLTDQYFDWHHMYSCSSLGMAALGLGGAAILANTEMDQHFQKWHDRYVRGISSDELADFFRPFGQGWYIIPVTVAASCLGPYCRYRCGSVIGDWGDRCVRSYLVGAPLVLALQFALGASRPNEDRSGSDWRPFSDENAVSGHAFIGSVPFIQASMMAESFWVKLAIFGLSSVTAWSRVNDGSHYLSQSLLGWWFAVLACEAVNMTDYAQRNFVIAPLAMNDTIGLGLICQR